MTVGGGSGSTRATTRAQRRGGWGSGTDCGDRRGAGRRRDSGPATGADVCMRAPGHRCGDSRAADPADDCGLDAATIASAFLTSPAAMGKRLVRAKNKIREAGIPLRVPEREELAGRLETVLEAIYATFAEDGGWRGHRHGTARSDGRGAVSWRGWWPRCCPRNRRRWACWR